MIGWSDIRVEISTNIQAGEAIALSMQGHLLLGTKHWSIVAGHKAQS